MQAANGLGGERKGRFWRRKTITHSTDLAYDALSKHRGRDGRVRFAGKSKSIRVFRERGGFFLISYKTLKRTRKQTKINTKSPNVSGMSDDRATNKTAHVPKTITAADVPFTCFPRRATDIDNGALKPTEPLFCRRFRVDFKADERARIALEIRVEGLRSKFDWTHEKTLASRHRKRRT